MWLTITPELPVADVAAAQTWYRDVLGCRIAWISPDASYGAVYADTHELFLALRPAPRPRVTYCVRVDDADAAYAACRETGAKIVAELGTRPWAMREFSVEDLDGHRVRIGQSTLGGPKPRSAEPASGAR
jgi:catechol 2,3-dioxygenase-like lactoylglutathione lyase family enzyme